MNTAKRILGWAMLAALAAAQYEALRQAVANTQFEVAYEIEKALSTLNAALAEKGVL